MPNEDHVAKLKLGAEKWNAWRQGEGQSELIDLESAPLGRKNLSGFDLTRANMHKAGLYRSKLVGADLTSAQLPEADLRNADLSSAILSEAVLAGADLTGAKLFGVTFHDKTVVTVDQLNSLALPPTFDPIVFDELLE